MLVPLGIVVLLALLLLLVAAFPVGLLRGLAERRLSAALEAPVRIGRLERLDALSFSPRLRVTDLRIAQPAWAGPGDLARVPRLTLRLRLGRLLRGRPAVDDIVADGAVLNLVRDANGRANWEGRRKRGSDGDGGGLDGLVVRDARLNLRDAKRGMILAGRLDSGAAGLRLAAAGTHRGRPLTLRLDGAPVRPGAWPFRLALASPLLRMDFAGRTARPLDLPSLQGRLTAAAPDFRNLDDVVEAGLPGTQPVRLSAQVRRDGRDWHLSDMAGRVGRSPFSGRLDVFRPGERVRLEGRVAFAALDFDDLAPDAAIARAAALRARIGPRVIPALRIDLSKLGRLDARMEVSARRLLSRTPSLFRSLSATAVLDRRRLTVSPLVAGLDHGRVTGSATVDHRAGAPKLALDLRVAGGRLEDILDGPDIRAPLAARIRMTGSGATVRDALARGTGSAGIFAEDGTIQRKLAVFAAGDVIKGAGTLISGGDRREALRCVAVRFAGRNGRLLADPLAVDTAVGALNGRGTLLLDGERLSLAIEGRARRPGLIQSTVPIRVAGTLSAPTITLIPLYAENKGVVSQIGAFLGRLRARGEEEVRAAPPLDCAALRRKVLR